MLLRCLQHLFNQRNAECDIIVIDNASTDGTTEAVAALGSDRVVYHRMEKNIGGAGGFNAGLHMAVISGYRRFWLMDDDTLPADNALDELLAADACLGGVFGWLSSVALWVDGKECKMNRQKLKKTYYEKAEFLPSGLILSEQATFVSLYLNDEVVRKVGLPIRDFFIWGDDIEYTRRIAVRNSVHSYVVTRSVVVHAMAGNTGSCLATDAIERIDRYRFAFRNEAFLYRQEGVSGVLYYLAKCAYNLGRIFVQAPGQRLQRMGVLFGSMVRGAFFHPRIEHIAKNIGELNPIDIEI
jgi:GT2 family glycosyltransferase